MILSASGSGDGGGAVMVPKLMMLAVGGVGVWRLAKELLDGLKESVVLAENESKK